MSDIKNIQNDYTAKLNNDLSLEEINQFKTELFGKNGLITSQFKNIGSIPEIDRKNFVRFHKILNHKHSENFKFLF